MKATTTALTLLFGTTAAFAPVPLPRVGGCKALWKTTNPTNKGGPSFQYSDQHQTLFNASFGPNLPFGNDDSDKFFGAATTGLVTALLFLAAAYQVVDTGEVGIVNQLGQLSQLDPGPHLVFPVISSVHRLTTKTQLLEQSNFVPTKEGLTVELDTAILYRLNPSQSVDVYGTIGKEYNKKLVEPEASSAVRGLTSEAEAKALYTSGRTAIQGKLKTELTQSLSPRGIIVEDVLLKAVKLPDELSKSIELKAKAEQESNRMEFVLQKEKLEAQRKSIEAEGIADFQKIVSKGITPDLLQWKGIEATTKLANSENTKIIIMGNGKNSLPVILGDNGK